MTSFPLSACLSCPSARAVFGEHEVMWISGHSVDHTRWLPLGVCVLCRQTAGCASWTMLQTLCFILNTGFTYSGARNRPNTTWSGYMYGEWSVPSDPHRFVFVLLCRHRTWSA